MMARARPNPESGFILIFVMAMAAAIAIALFAAMPRVAFEAQRQKEQVLISRGEEYKRAIQLYVRKFSRYPATLEALENTNNMRFLRRRYKDPMTGKDEWRLIHAGPGGVFTDSLTMKPQRPNKDKNGKDTGISEIGASSSDTAAVAGAPVPVSLGKRRRPSDSSPSMGSQGLEGQTAGDYQPPADNAADQGTQIGMADPGTQQPPQQFGQPQFGQPGNPQDQGVPGAQEGEGVPAQPGVDPQQTGQTAQPGVQQPGFGPRPMPGGQQQIGPGQFVSGGMGGGMGAGVYPSGPASVGNQFAQQPINQVTPFAPQPAVPQPGAMDASGNQGAQNPVDIINQQLRGGTANRPGFAGPNSQALGGGIAGVASKAENEGIKIYRKKTKYKEWEFIYDPKQDMTSPANRGGIAQPGFGGGPVQQPVPTGNRQTQ